MKQLLYIATLVFTLCFALSCTKEEPAMLNVDTTELNFTKNGGTKIITITTNRNWTAETDASWLTVTESGASTNTMIMVTAEPNPEYKDRSTIVTIKVENIEQQINVKQSTNQALIISKNDFDLSDEAQTIEVEVETNIDFEYTIDEACKSWISAADTKGLSVNKVNFNISRNDSYGDRQGTIVFKQKGGDLTETVTINQVQNDAIIISEKNYNLSEEEQTLEIEVKANIDFEYTIDQACQSWISAVETKGLSVNKINFNIARNDSYDSREGKIVFKQVEGSITETINIVQGQKNAIIIAYENIYFEANGKTAVSVRVESNIPYDVTISDEAKSWLSVIQGTKALSSSYITIAASENTTNRTRSGLIVVSGEDITKEIYVRQEPGHIFVKETEFEIGSDGDEFKLEVSHNISYEAEISGNAKSWITYNAAKSNENELWYTVSANESPDARTGHIWVRNGDFDIPVRITQAQKDSIFVNKDKVEVPLAGGTFSVDISTNINISVEIEEAAKGWISQIETKATQESTLNFSISYNDLMTSREGKIIISGNGIRKTIDVYQAGPILVTGISLDKNSLEIFEGSSKSIHATVAPADATYKDIVWETSDAAIATVEGGMIKAITRGSATITAKCGGFSASCEVTVLGEEDLDFTRDVWMQLTGTSLTISDRYYYGRTYTIRNDSPVDIQLTEIGTTNFLSLTDIIPAGSTQSITLYFSYNVYPKVTLRFKYNNKDYEVYLENY